MKILLSFLLFFQLFAHGADFFDFSDDSYKSDAQNAKDNGKKAIMIFFSMADCPFCSKMKQNVLNQNEVVQYYKENFAIFEHDIDGQIEIEDFEGNAMTQKDFAFKNRVRATPVIAFFDLDGNKIFSRTGYSNKEEFMLLGKYIAEGIYKTENFVKYKREMLKK